MGTATSHLESRPGRPPTAPAGVGREDPAEPGPRALPIAGAGLPGELTRERLRSARDIDRLRLAGVSAFFLLFLVLGGLLHRPVWTGNLVLFAAYWILSGGLVWAGRRFERAAPVTLLAVALVDVPMVFLLQRAALPGSPSPGGVAGFTAGVYVLLVILSARALRGWYVCATAAAGAACAILLQWLAGVGVGGMISTVILLALAAAASAHGPRRLVELAGRVERAEQGRSSRALERAERLASLGTLAAGVAHEINTPLTYVVTNLALIAERMPPDRGAGAAGPRPPAGGVAALDKAVRDVRAINDRLVASFKGRLTPEMRHEFNNVQMLMMHAIGKAASETARLAALLDGHGAPSPDGLRGLLDRAREGAERVRTIVRDLETFARPGDEPLRALDLRGALTGSVNLTASEVQHRARLVTDLRPVPLVMASEGRLGQVFVNLLVNAVQAIPEGAPQHNEIRVTTGADRAGRAVIEVADTGAGIAAEHLGRLFDPFFTTKPVGRGTGLGLSICHGIVTGLGGELSVESVPGRGSTFRVALPAAPAGAAIAPPGEPPPAAGAARRARVLVVDDDPGIGEIVREVLVPEHEVVAATSGVEALRLLEAGSAFDLILCDLMMPLMTGMQFHAEVARRAPAQAAGMVFMTGGAFTPRAQAFVAAAANPVLGKPFTPAELREMVTRALGAARPSRREPPSG